MTDMPEEIWGINGKRAAFVRADVAEARIAEAVAKQVESVVAELARLRELEALVREWQAARAEATKTTDEYLRQVRPSAFAIVRLTQAEQALSAWRPT